ncbi:hypothetical protein MSG28_007582 [Choristoneura fumiferana]|uniref:Uncharacterized protein n=1 Tax=Choristoneura fumiferana TaxID=7141 RepID=A0ACC0JYH3_CHOFU|nr:hypothetical protein MSG28_007582 [Choristoneura fumiferana]
MSKYRELKELKQKINELQQKKSTRDEVTDALSDKAGIAALNGLVTMEQYQAVRGDFEKRIGHAYDKFNNKEITWQFNAETDEDLSETRPPVIGAETAPAKEDLTKKYRKCYPGYPVTHPIDPRSLICHHYCGTTAPTERESAFKMQISELNPNHGSKVGTDAKTPSASMYWCLVPSRLCPMMKLQHVGEE